MASSDDSDFDGGTHIGSQISHNKSSLMQASSDSADEESHWWSSKAMTRVGGDSIE